MILLGLGCSTPEPPPDVLVVVLDTARADRLATYGYERDTSYQLNAVAESGVVFEQAYTAGTWTWPGHAELFTGEPPWISGAHYAEPGGPSHIGEMDATLPTLAERLGERGYRTVSHSTNKLLDPALGMTRGFEVAEVHRTDGDTVKAVRDELATDTEAPLFLFVNVLIVHTPFFVVDPVPWSGQHRERIESAGDDEVLAKMRVHVDGALAVDPSQDCGDHHCNLAWTQGEVELESELTLISDLYDGGIVQADNALRALVGAWGARGGVVAVTSDHGEFLGEHRMLLHQYVTLPPVLHVPLVVSGPGMPKGARVAEPVQLADLHYALLEMLGQEQERYSLLDALNGVERGPIQAAAWPDPTVSGVDLIAEPWRFHMDGGSFVALRGDEVAVGDPALAEAARAIPLTPNNAALGDDVMKTLQALGYMD